MHQSVVTANISDASGASGEEVTRFGPGGGQCYRGGYSGRDNSAERGIGATLSGKGRDYRYQRCYQGLAKMTIELGDLRRGLVTEAEGTKWAWYNDASCFGMATFFKGLTF